MIPLKRFENFDQSDEVLFKKPQLALPAHKPRKTDKMVVELKDLYRSEQHNILNTANGINNLIEDSGTYLKVRDIRSNIWLISQNEPFVLFGMQKGQSLSIGSNKDIDCKDDSIIINVRGDDSLFVLSVKDAYEFTFIRPNIVVSSHDPYGEEDWEEEEED